MTGHDWIIFNVLISDQIRLNIYGQLFFTNFFLLFMVRLFLFRSLICVFVQTPSVLHGSYNRPTISQMYHKKVHFIREAFFHDKEVLNFETLHQILGWENSIQQPWLMVSVLR